MTQPPRPRAGQEGLAAVPRHRAFIGMGGNLGNVQARLKSALEGMSALPGTAIEAVSSLYRTRPVQAEGPDYLNAVAALRSALGPEELLRALQRLEIAHDRERSHVNAPRTLDLDLLWYGDLRHDSRTLILPHPRMMQRAFVLVPLAQVLDGLPPEEEPGLRAAMPSPAERERLAALQGIATTGALF